MIGRHETAFGGRNFELSAEDARQLTEVALALRNLSFALGEMIVSGADGADGRISGALLSLYRQTLQTSDRLDTLSRSVCSSVTPPVPPHLRLGPPRGTQTDADRLSASADHRPAG